MISFAFLCCVKKIIAECKGFYGSSFLSCMSVDDGSSHLQSSLERASILGASTVCGYHHKNINNGELMVLFNTHINHNAGTVLLFIVSKSLASEYSCLSYRADARVKNGLHKDQLYITNIHIYGHTHKSHVCACCSLVSDFKRENDTSTAALLLLCRMK